MAGDPKVPAYRIEKLNEAFESLDKLLDGRNWLVGDSYTLADISIVTTLTSLEVNFLIIHCNIIQN